MFTTRLNPTKPSAAHRAVLERVGTACRELSQVEEACFAEGRASEQIAAIFAKHGVLRIGIDPEFGGVGTDPLLLVLAVERIGREGFALLSVFATHVVGAATLGRWGTGEQKARLLPQIARGNLVIAFASGDRHMLQEDLIYEETSTGFVLNGRKPCLIHGRAGTTLATIAGARSAANGGCSSAFLVDLDSPRVFVQAGPGQSRLPGGELWDVQLNDCAVSREHLLGDLGCGVLVLSSETMNGELCMAAGSLGVIADCLETWARLVQARFGGRSRDDSQLKPLCAHVATTATDLEAARALVYAAATLKAEFDQHRGSRHLEFEAQTLVREAKYFATGAVERMFSCAAELVIDGPAPLGELPLRHRPLQRAKPFFEEHQDLLEMGISRYYLSP